MSIAEKFEIIADEVYAKGYTSGQYSVYEGSEQLPIPVSGEIIRIDDMSKVPHKATVNKRRKNIFNGELKIWRNLDRIMPVEAVKVKPNTWYRITVFDYTIQEPIFAVYGNHTGEVDTTTDTVLGSMATSFNSGEFEYIWFRQWRAMTDDGITLGSKVQIEEVANSTAPATAYAPYIENLDAVKVYKYGKNLATAQEIYSHCGNYSELVEDGRNCVRCIDSGRTTLTPIKFKPNTQYTVSFWHKREIRSGEGHFNSNFFIFKYTDGTESGLYSNQNYGEWVKISATSKEGKTIASIGVTSYHYVVWLYIDVDTFQFEEGATATEYEPYHKEEIGETFDSTTDIVTLMADTSGVILDCQYLRDIDKGINEANVAGRNAAWAALQHYGKEGTPYGYMFYNMDANDFWPVYDIKLTGNEISSGAGVGTFRNFNRYYNNDTFDLSARCAECGITINPNKHPSLQYFMLGIAVSRIPKIDLSGVTNTYMCFYDTHIKIIDGLVFDETTLPNANMFLYSSKLTTITEVEGVIAKSISFSYNPLDVPTMNRIIACLKDYSSTGGTYTLTLKADRETMLTDEEKAVATNKGWTLVWS